MNIPYKITVYNSVQIKKKNEKKTKHSLLSQHLWSCQKNEKINHNFKIFMLLVSICEYYF